MESEGQQGLFHGASVSRGSDTLRVRLHLEALGSLGVVSPASWVRRGGCEAQQTLPAQQAQPPQPQPRGHDPTAPGRVLLLPVPGAHFCVDTVAPGHRQTWPRGRRQRSMASFDLFSPSGQKPKRPAWE